MTASAWSHARTAGAARVTLAALAVAGLALVGRAATPARAQETFDFYGRGPYRAEVPRPADLLGYEPGEFHTDYGRMLAVTDAIARAAADRVRIVPYGRSVEGRPLRLLVITAPENLRRLDEIRAAVARLADPRTTSPEEARAIARRTPVIVWLNYANDGNESAAFEAAIHVAYELAASENPEILGALRDAVVIVNPAHNPESHERFVAWYNAMGMGDTAHVALEHDAFWSLSTNNNHYQIDLNRDFLPLSQRETRAVAAAILHWNPQVVVDHHGQTEQYFFPPTARPMNPTLAVEQQRKWESVFGRANAEAFDRYGWPYYSRHIFDFYYPGYADVWPSLNGATGMTYETDGGGDLGYRWRRQDGTVVTLRDGIARHVTASHATVRAAAAHREERLLDFYEFRRSAIAEARRKPYARFVIVPGADPERAGRLVEILLRSRIEVRRLDRPVRSDRAHGYLDGRRVSVEFPAGAYVVDLAQPQARLVETLLAPDLPLDSVFVREQLRARARNARRGPRVAKEWYEFYDVTAWSLPLSFGVEAYWTEDAPPVPATPVEAEFDPAQEPWTPPWRLPTHRVADLPAAVAATVDGGVTGRARSAYVFEPGRDGAARLAVALLREGFEVAVATRELRAEGQTHPRGTWVVRVDRNPPELHDRIAALAREFGVPVRALATAYIDEGTAGVGSETVLGIALPRVVVLAGEPVDTRGYGHLWYTLRREFGIPFTPVRADRFDRLDLRTVDVLVLPPGDPDGYRAALGDEGIERLRRWVRDGGVLVGIAGGAVALADPELELTTARVVGRKKEEEEGEEKADTLGYLPPTHGTPVAPLPAARAGERAPLPVPGAIVRAAVDRTHPFTFGYETDAIAVLLRGDDFLARSKEGAHPIAFVGDSLRIAGFVWPENTERYLKDTAYLVDEPMGDGRVVLFQGDPVFRLAWPALHRLLVNVLLLGPTIR